MNNVSPTSDLEPMRTAVQKINKDISAYAADPEHAQLIAVSKTQSIMQIRAAFALGVVHFGENYVQEFTEKHEKLTDLDIKWHFIGRLQSNKIKFIVGKVEWIHSVDSERLALAISRRAQDMGLQQQILLQVNVSGEATKGGFSPAELRSKIKVISGYPGLVVGGLMTLPPEVDDPQNVRSYFRDLKNLLNELKPTLSGHPFVHLSMGMSHDYTVALAEGATMIRVGTLVFGERRNT